MVPEDVGVGLEYGVVRLETVPQEWVAAGARLAADVERALAPNVVAVEHVGSTAVPGMLAKPVIDLAIGVASLDVHDRVRDVLDRTGWTYRGDSGDSGGHVYVLEIGPSVRAAHIHVVEHGGSQWRDYIGLRDRLRGDRVARDQYGRVKVELAERFSGDNRHQDYTLGKTDVITRLLRDRP